MKWSRITQETELESFAAAQPQFWVDVRLSPGAAQSRTGRVAPFPPASDPDRAAISFRDWAAVLAEAGLPAAQREAFHWEIVAFLRHCKVHHAPASVALARIDVGGHEPAREAFR